ncbi:MAG TPA: caspase family protein, partial [Kofleriaceae bacterium]|nr:caspase family protein [Kofleriaceae bacterium]
MFRERGARVLREARDVVITGTGTGTAAEAPRAGRQVIATIGIDSYRHWRRLHNAARDAEGVAGLFHRLGFEDVVPPLLDERATRGAIDGLTHQLRRLDPSDSLVVFYAGHGGVRTERVGEHEVRTGYLIPVDADDDDDQIASWIELDAW